MKFKEKLIELRKKAGLSQEQLAEKLDVTRQTISKWELGQTKPDIGKLKEMANIFEVDVNELTTGEKTKPTKTTNNKGTRKWILYVVIILLIASIAILCYRLSKNVKENKGTGIFDRLTDINIGDFGKTSFNNQFELYAGTTSGFLLETHMSDLITSNKTNSNHLIELIFDDISYGTDTTKISEMKDTLKNDTDYELSFEYDNEGYINKFVVKTKEKKIKINVDSFNISMEYSVGTQSGNYIEIILSKIITSNQKYPNLQIEVVFDGTSYGTDVNRIREAKDRLDIWTKYEIMVEYDSEGYINKYIVETK